jgi:hypothetical protein
MLNTTQEAEATEVPLTAYIVTREYGGPEEGGWWWDRYEALETVMVQNTFEHIANKRRELERKYDDRNSKTASGRVRELSSMLCSGVVKVCEDDGERARREMPVYE